jgi:hypothetical protein
MGTQRGAHGILRLTDRTVTSGSLKTATVSADASSVDTGRSSQPEMSVANVSQYAARSHKKALRSSLLSIRWKPVPLPSAGPANAKDISETRAYPSAYFYETREEIAC